MTRFKTMLRCFSAAVPTVIVMAAAQPAFAQQAPDSQSQQANAASGTATTGNEIIVTAQGRQQRLQDVPVAVSVVSGEALQQANIHTLEDMAARLPDVKISTGTITNTLTIRGVGSGGNAGFEQSVATFVDGIYRSRSRSTNAALFDIDRVEVLKGPQTTFFGANAIAGALNITTRKPGTTFDYNASAYFVPVTREYNAQVGVDVPLGDTLSARFAGRLFGSNGYVHNDRLNETGPNNRASQGRFSLRWEPSNSFRSDFRIEGSHSVTHNAAPYQLTNCPPPAGFALAPVNTCNRYLKQNGGVIDSTLDYHTSTGVNDATYDYLETALTNRLNVGSGSLTSITGYFWHHALTTGQAVPFPLTDAVVGLDGYPTVQNERYHQFSQELRYQSAEGGPFEYMFGGYFAQDDLSVNTIVGFRFLPFGASDKTGTYNAKSPLAGNNQIDQQTRTLSAFASATIRPVEHLRINLGARYANIRKDANRSATPGLAAGDNPATSFQNVSAADQNIIAGLLATNRANFPITTRTDTKFMPSASIQYDLAPRVMIYASYANGFKAGGFSFGAQNEIFQPETVNDYEAGIKGEFLDRKLTLDLTVYRSDYQNLQETSLQLQPSGAISSLVQNAARSRSQGVELTAGINAASWLKFNTSIAYLDAKYTSYPNGACTIAALAANAKCVQDLSGKQRAFAPEWSGNVGATVTVPVGNDYQVKIDPLLYFSSSYYELATADPLLQQPSYAKVDLRIAFGPSDGRWQVAVIGKNLTNKLTASYRQAIPVAPGSVSALVDPPRTVGVQFTIRR